MADNRRFLKMPSTTVLEYHYISEPPLGHSISDGFSYVPLGDEIAHYEHVYNVPVPDDFIVVWGPHYMPLGVVDPGEASWEEDVNSFESLVDDHGDPIPAYYPVTHESEPFLREGKDGKYRYYKLVDAKVFYQLGSRYPTDLKPGELGVGRRQGHETLFITSSNTNENPLSFRNYIEGRGIKIVENEINLQIASATNIGGVQGPLYDATMHSNYDQVVISDTGQMYSKPGTDTTYGTFTTASAGLVPTATTNTSYVLNAAGGWVEMSGDTTYGTFTTANNGLVPASGTNTTKYLKGDGTWGVPTDTTYGTFTTADNGLVPASQTTSTNLFLNAQGNWVNPQDSDTTYGTFTTANAGLTPASGNNTDKYLKGDGTWSVPTNNTYTATGELQVSSGTFTHKTSGVTEGSYGASTDITIGEGQSGSIVVPQVTVNEYGHVTAATNRTLSVTIPSIPDAVISDYTAPTYHSEHLSNTWVNVFTTNVVANGNTYSAAVQKVDTKVSGLADELAYTEAGMAQAYVDAREADRYYGVCSTAADTAAKTVTIADYDATNYEEGDRFIIAFPNGSTVANPTLAIGGLPAKNIKFNGANVDDKLIQENSKLLVVYKDNAFHIVGGASAQYYVLNGTTNTATTNGYLVAGAGTNANTNYFLDATGNWAIPVDTTYGTFTTANNGLVPASATSATNLFLNAQGNWINPQDSDTTYGTFTTGYNGLVPMSNTNTNAYLQGNGNWTVPTDTTYGTFASGYNGLVPGATTTSTNAYLNAAGGWTVPTNTTYDKLSATNTATGTGYLVAGAGTNTDKFLQGDGSWTKPTDTTYGTFASGYNGLVPGATTTSTNSYLNAAGGWTVPVDTTYGTFTTTGSGLAPTGTTNTNAYLNGMGQWTIPQNDNTTYGTFTTADDGLVPKASTNTNNFLRADGSWVVPTDTTYGTFTTANGLVPGRGTNTNAYLQANGEWSVPTDTTYNTFGTGYNGLVPMSSTNTGLFLQGNGTWAKPTDTTYTTFASGTSGLVPGFGTNTTGYLNADGTWKVPTDTTYGTFTTANNGLVPKPTSANTNWYLNAAGNWTNPQDSDTTYGTFTTGEAGLTPASGNNTNKFLMGNGSWSTPTDTTYGTFTTANAGLAPALNNNGSLYLNGQGGWTKPTDTTYDATGIITKSAANVFSHDTSGVTEGTYGPSTNITVGGGQSASMVVPQVTVDEYGHVTLANARTLSITIPAQSDETVSEYDAPTYPTEHVSTTFVNVITTNVVANGDTYSEAINKLDRKLAETGYELAYDEAAMAQAYVDAREANRYYGVCSTAAATAAKTVTIADFDDATLTDGERFVIQFDNASTATNPTLQINYTTAYPIKFNGSAVNASTIKAGNRFLVVFKDNAYHLIGGATYNAGTGLTLNTNNEFVLNVATSTMIGGVKGNAYNATTHSNYVQAVINTDGTIYARDLNTTYATFTTGGNGLVPAPTTAGTNLYLNASGGWTNPADSDTTYGTFTTGYNGLVPMSNTNTSLFLQGNGTWSKPTDTTYNTFSSGYNGLVPGATTTSTNSYLNAAGGWTVPINTTYGTFTTAGSGLTPAGTTNTNAYLNGMGGWTIPVNTTYGTFTSGNSGLVPGFGTNTSGYLNADGTWSTPTNTTYNTFGTSYNGLVPMSGTNTSAYLQGNGTWSVPTDTTYATLGTSNTSTTTGYLVKGAGSSATTNYFLNGTGNWAQVQTTDTTYGIISATNTATNTGYVVPGAGQNTGLYLQGNGTWSKPTDTTYAVFNTEHSGLVPQSATTNSNRFLRGDGSWIIPTDTTYGTFNTSRDGLVPQSATTNSNQFLKGNGTWGTPTDTTYDTLGGTNTSTTGNYLVHGAGSTNTNSFLNASGNWSTPTDHTYGTFNTSRDGLVPQTATTNSNNFLKGDGTWGTPTDTTYGTFTNSSSGLVPQSATTNSNRFLRGDGSWVIPTDTTYGTFNSANGLVPGTTNTGSFLRGDGQWTSPTNTTYGTVTTANPGLAPTITNTGAFLKGDGTWAVPTNTTYDSTGVITKSAANVFSHDTSGVQTGTYGPNTNISVQGGQSASMVVPQVTVDEYGHVTTAEARTLSITIPSDPVHEISGYEAPYYDTTHVSTTWSNIIGTNVVVNGDTYSGAINKVDNKVAGLSNEVGYVEAAMAQAYVDAREADRYYGTCAAAATNTNKTVTISDYDANVLTEGDRFVICFTNGSTTTNANLTINSNLGTYPIRYNGAAPATNLIQPNSRLLIAYQGNAFHIVGGAGGNIEVFTGATATNNGTVGSVPAPLSAETDQNKYLRGNGDWDDLKLMDSITIAGWDGKVGSGEYSNGETIPAGSNIEEVLRKLLCKITWPTPTYAYTWTVSGNAAAVTNSGNYSSNTHVKVGTTLTMSATYNAPSVVRRGVVNDMTNGYFTSLSGARNTDTSYTENYTSTTSGSLTMSLSYSGFSGASNTSVSTTTFTSPTLTVNNGTNSFTAATTSQTYSAGTTGTTTLYPASSALAGDSSHTAVLSNANALAQVSTWNTAKTGTASRTVNIIGYWPYYYGFVNTPITTFTSANIRGLSANNEYRPGSYTSGVGSRQFVLAVPSTSGDYSKTTMSVINAVNGSSFSSGSSTATLTVYGEDGSKSTTYKVFYMTAAEGTSSATLYNISLS